MQTELPFGSPGMKFPAPLKAKQNKFKQKPVIFIIGFPIFI